MDPAAEAALHFGGGFQPKQGAADGSKEAEVQPKSKKQVLISQCLHFDLLPENGI